MTPNYNRTMYACFIGYIVQAIVNNFVPLLFVTFESTYHIPLSKITLLITINFLIQLLIDMLSAKFADKIGYKTSVMIAHICSAVGLVSLTVLPELLPNSFIGILISVSIYAVGGGLIEVLISPIVEACPSDNKEKAMSLLHSFYCWGHVGVVLLSTVFFATAGIQNWKILTVLWALIPVLNMLLFAKAPFFTLPKDSEAESGNAFLFQKPAFWLLMLMMLCAGASEQAVSQWASTFAEQGLGVSKTVGDLAGPMSFALLMGLSRLIYGKFGERIALNRFMKLSTILCIASYLAIALVPIPLVGLIGCAVCGFSVGILWPGTYSKAAATIKGGTALFAWLAFAGDVGCAGGPTIAGMVSSAFRDNLRMGILFAIIFPLLMLLSLWLSEHKEPKKNQLQQAQEEAQ